MKTGISIIICCYNSASRIRETLEHVLALEVPIGYGMEVLVIDNNSTDKTELIARETFAQHGNFLFRFAVVKEPAQGLNAARQRGIAESKFNLLLFCDDDNHLEENYLIAAKKIFDENPKIGILGGWNRPAFSSPQPEWLEDFYGALAIEKEPRINKGRVSWVFGAGMIVSKEVYDTIIERQIKLLLTDRAGKKQTSGGDIEFCLLANWLGYLVYYSSELRLFHKIGEDRLNAKNFLSMNTDNFLPTIHLFLMEKIMHEKEVKFLASINILLIQRIKRSFLALPRLIMGRKLLLNVLEFYGNIVVVGWVLINLHKIKFSFNSIKNNLYQN